MKYVEPGQYSREEVENAIASNSETELIDMVISASMFAEDGDWAETVCLRLANHSNSSIRGNAILGFGHISRVHGKVSSPVVKDLLKNALLDQDEYVRGQAEAALDDLEHFLGWQINGSA